MKQVFKMQHPVLHTLCAMRFKPGSEQGFFPTYSKNILLDFSKHGHLEPFPGHMLGLL